MTDMNLPTKEELREDLHAELTRIRAIVARVEDVEGIAEIFHVAYERLAPQFGYRTRDDTACPWVNVPDDNRRLMIATVEAVRDYVLSGGTP